MALKISKKSINGGTAECPTGNLANPTNAVSE
jgi:hypothetical protein